MKKNLINGIIRISYIVFFSLYLSISSCKPFENCTKKFLLSGKIVDQSSTPIADVKIRWHYEDTSISEWVLGYTDSSGNYSIPHQNFGGLQGASIEFVKTGFATQIGQSYSGSEAGSPLCGELTLIRNATLAP